MKPSQFAKKAGVTSRTAFRWWQQGQLKSYRMPSGTIVVTEGEKSALQPGWVVISARLCSRKQAEDLERQVPRDAQRGYLAEQQEGKRPAEDMSLLVRNKTNVSEVSTSCFSRRH